MKREELKQILGDDVSDDVIKKIMDLQGNEATKAKNNYDDLKQKYDEVSDKLKEAEDKAEKDKMAKLSDDDRLKKMMADAEKVKKQAEEALAKNKAEFVKFKVKNKFAESGLKEDDYKDFIDNMKFDDEDVAMSSANALVTMLNNKIDATKQQVKEEQMKNMPTPTTSTGGTTGGTETTQQPFTRSADDIKKFYK
jgi:hypothetical protein